MENNFLKGEKDASPTFYHSSINGELRVKWVDGKKVLNTKNTNYSYGLLKKVLKYGLNRIPLEDAESVLLLGMGAGSIIKPIKKRYSSLEQFIAVDIDSLVVDIAKKEFGVFPSDRLSIIEADAIDFIKECEFEFELIIVDIFIDLKVPKAFYEASFWQDIADRLKVGGFALFNAGIDLDEDKLNSFLDNLPDTLLYQVNFKVYESNTVIILNKYC